MRGLVPTESNELAWAAIAARSRRDLWLHRSLCAPLLRWTVRRVEAMVLPGIQLHYAVRKRFLDDAARRAIDDGVRQVVVVGAGFDALALRLSRRTEGPVCIEVDHPATQGLKRDALARLTDPPGDLRLVPADLSRESLTDALSRAGYDPTLRTLFVAEGLTMYLEEDAVKRLLTTCADHAPADSYLAWTFMEPTEDGRVAFRGSRRGIVDAWLRARREPFTWGIAREALAAFVRPLGFEVVDVAGDADLRARYLTGLGIDAPLAAGEVVCVLRRP